MTSRILLAASVLALYVGETASAQEVLQTPTPADAAILKRIFDNWRICQERTKSLHCVAEMREGGPPRSNLRRVNPDPYRAETWIEGNQRFRFDEFSMRLGAKVRVLEQRVRRVYDGATSSRLDWLPTLDAAPRAVICRQVRSLDEIERETVGQNRG